MEHLEHNNQHCLKYSAKRCKRKENFKKKENIKEASPWKLFMLHL